MHDPRTVAFEIRYPWKKYGNRGQTEFERTYRSSFITIWHNDPESDGSDDSCGWFKLARHGNPTVLKKIKGLFAFDWDASYGGWFTEVGMPRLSVQGIVVNMFFKAAYAYFGDRRERAMRFIKSNLPEILLFAENNTDSLHDSITNRYGSEPRERRIEAHAAIIYGWVLRAERHWYQHPRWHIWHWSLQVHPWQQLRRRFWDKCCICGKRGFPKGESAMGDWGGSRLWHASCDQSNIKPSEMAL